MAIFLHILSKLSAVLVRVDDVVVPLRPGERLQQQIEEDSSGHEQSHQQHPLLWLGVYNLHEVWKPHEVAISVYNKRSSKVPCFYEEER